MTTFQIIQGVIEMIGNLAVAGALIISLVALGFSVGAFWQQRKISQANMFHNTTVSINSLLKDELEYYDEDGNEKDTYENWLDRLLTALEYYAFYANHHYIPKDMSEFYSPVIEKYCNEALRFSGLLEEIKEMEKDLVYCELRKYFQIYIKKPCPF